MRFDFRSKSLFADGSMGTNVNIFGADMSSSVHIDDRKGIRRCYKNSKI